MTGSSQQNPGSGQPEVDWVAHWIDKFGSKEAIETETPQEQMIERVLSPFQVKAIYVDPRTKDVSHYIEYLGLESEPMDYDDLKPHIAEAVSSAYTIPKDLRGVLEEYRAWDDLAKARHHVCGWGLPIGALARELILEHVLASRPALTIDDIAVRVDWLVTRATYEFDLGHKIIHRLHGQLQRDFSAVCATPGPDRTPVVRARIFRCFWGGGK